MIGYRRLFISSISILLLLIIPQEKVDGKIVEGTLSTNEKWNFIDRFAFLSGIYDPGLLSYEIEYDSGGGYVSLLLYPDKYWRKSFMNSTFHTCEEKVNALDFPNNERIILMPPNQLVRDSHDSGCEPKNEIESGRLICKQRRTFSSVQRWWYIAMSSCNNFGGLSIKHRLEMTNDYKAEFFYHHFSVDEFGFLQIYISFTLIYFVLFFVGVTCAFVLKREKVQDFIRTYIIFLISTGLQFLGLIASLSAYAIYAARGILITHVKLIGKIFESSSELFFMLLLLAEGYKTRKNGLDLRSKLELSWFTFLYVDVYALLLIFGQNNVDPSDVSFFDETPAGYKIQCLKFIAWVFFALEMYIGWRNNLKKRSFYIWHFGIYSFWFLSYPVYILLINERINQFTREKVAISLKHTLMLVGHLVFVVSVLTTQFGGRVALIKRIKMVLQRCYGIKNKNPFALDDPAVFKDDGGDGVKFNPIWSMKEANDDNNTQMMNNVQISQNNMNDQRSNEN